MMHTFRYLLFLAITAVSTAISAQTYNQIDEQGNITRRNERVANFNPHSDDTTTTKPIPVGLHVWTVDRRFGDIRPAEIDTMPHLFMRKTFNEGLYGEYNSIGNNYSARQNRIFADRQLTSQFLFTQPYDFVYSDPDEFHFVNTLSPLTNMSYYSCGDKTDGEDRLEAKFAVNANKRLGGGFDVKYDYARGYFSNQNVSHFNFTLFTSYLGDHYQMHLLASLRQHKASENGGIENDNYVTHPEAYSESYSDNEIPTILSQNWNRNKDQHLFFTHRYNLGFYRELPRDTTDKSDTIPRRELVPVTSFFHTLEVNNHRRTYFGYQTPTDYYANTFMRSDSLRDETRHFQIKNYVGVALLEGFNKYAKAGLKVFAAHELRNFKLPDFTADSTRYEHKWTEHNVSIGGKLSKTEGRTLHYNANAELWVGGEDAGQLKADFDTDLNFKLFGDTVRLAASAFFYRLNPVFYQRHYHASNFWWDQDLSKETRTRLEGRFTYDKTNTLLRIAVEEIQNYTYFGMSYTKTDAGISKYTAGVYQHTGNINVITAQLCQNLRLGPLHWDNRVTYQNSSNESVLPLPALNLFTNLYFHFKIAGVLTVDLGGDATFFTKYYAPDFCPQLNQYAIQQNVDSRVRLGEYPFVNVYANMHLKRARFFIMLSNVVNGGANRKEFLTPHYPTNGQIIRTGISWNFFN